MAIVTPVSTLNISESIRLDEKRKLFLKPIAKMVVSVTLPEMKLPGLTISNWEVMEKIKSMVAPEQFSFLKVTKSSLEVIQFDGETDSKKMLHKFIGKLDNKLIKLSGIPDPLKVRAVIKKCTFPKKHDWDAFFRDVKNMNECMPGERPDTLIVKGLPTKWFTEKEKDDKPSERVIESAFRTFGEIRTIDVPILDSYRHRMSEGKEDHTSGFKTFSYGSNIHFECFVQYSDHAGFEKAMSSFRGMKLLRIMDDGRAAAASIDVDFDRSAHLSERNIRKRNMERKLLIEADQKEETRLRQAKEEAERKAELERLAIEEAEKERIRSVEEALIRKEQRRAEREKRRRQKIESKRKEQKRQKVLEKLKAKAKTRLEKQRVEEAKRLLVELLQRISDRKQIEEIEGKKREAELKMLRQIGEKRKKLEEEKRKEEDAKIKREEHLKEQEFLLRDKLIKNLQDMEEKKKELERELLRKRLKEKGKISGRLKGSKNKAEIYCRFFFILFVDL